MTFCFTCLWELFSKLTEKEIFEIVFFYFLKSLNVVLTCNVYSILNPLSTICTSLSHEHVKHLLDFSLKHEIYIYLYKFFKLLSLFRWKSVTLFPAPFFEEHCTLESLEFFNRGILEKVNLFHLSQLDTTCHQSEICFFFFFLSPS